jgi:hypothetical protein
MRGCFRGAALPRLAAGWTEPGVVPQRLRVRDGDFGVPGGGHGGGRRPRALRLGRICTHPRWFAFVLAWTRITNIFSFRSQNYDIFLILCCELVMNRKYSGESECRHHNRSISSLQGTTVSISRFQSKQRPHNLHYIRKNSRASRLLLFMLGQEDINLMKGLNFDAYRFSISWSRIFPGITNLTEL